ncbi:efflux RND transporter permease subunit [uncultured Erythrobacter sp.]|uniref:efflux RND transporter permease subunit n=1 Tax=uncultured Erythrobacter sp. TaxID=263913 RepID=UPI00262A4892|nr:efflux RND transporter permease subunit [uncultured Erythrobacter sp.]
MGFIEFAVRRGRATLLGALLLGILGIQAYLSIPRSVDPHFPTPFTVTTVILPGADAGEIEQSIAKPVERALQGVENVREIRSTSVNGSARIVTEFEHGTDAELSLDRVIRQVNSVQGSLPTGISSVESTRPRTSDAAVMQLALISDDANWIRVVKFADDLREKLSALPNVRSVSIEGAAEPEVSVRLDSNRLATAGLSVSLVTSALEQGGLRLPGGALESGTRRYNVDAGGAFRTLEAIRAIPIVTSEGRRVTVEDVASVEWAEAERRHITRFNGRRAVFLSIRQKDGSDVKALQQRALATIGEFRTLLPPDMELQTGFDQSEAIDSKLRTLQRDFFIALGLVLLTLAPLGRRASIIVMVSIPLSLAAGVLFLWTIGHSLNQVSLSGLIVSLGLVVDDSIVVIENIERRLRDGDSPITAAIEGARGISAAVVGATAVLLMAFLPLAMIPESAGDFVRGLPIAVIATVVSSLVVSMTIIPYLASRLAPDGGKSANSILQWLNRTIHTVYSPVLRAALRRPLSCVLGSMALCVAALGLLPQIGFSLFPSAETPYFLIRIQTPQGSSLATTDAVVSRISSTLEEQPLVRNRMENAGTGHPQMFYNVLPSTQNVRDGEILVTLDEWDKNRVPDLLERLQAEFENDPDAQISVLPFENGPPVEAPIAIRVRGPDLAELRGLAAAVSATLRATPGLREVNNPVASELLELSVEVDPDKAAILGVSSGDVRLALNLAIEGKDTGLLIDSEGDSWPVTARLAEGAGADLSVLDSIYIPTSQGSTIPLSRVAKVELQSEPAQIYRRAFERSATVTARVDPDRNVANATKDVVERLEAIDLPSGYSLSLGGNAETAERNFSGLWSIAILSMFGILLVIVIEFGRFRDALVVAAVVPLGLLGGLLALFLTGNSLSFYASIGFIALAGIEVKNSILFVDFANKQMAKGLSIHEAIERAGELRFLPVLLTSATAIGGLLPLALGKAALYSPLAWVIIGGLVSSTALGRVITPAVYLLVIQGLSNKDRESTHSSPGANASA